MLQVATVWLLWVVQWPPAKTIDCLLLDSAADVSDITDSVVPPFSLYPAPLSLHLLQEWLSWRSSCAGCPSTWAGRFSFLPTMLLFYTLCPSTSIWCPLSSSTSALQSIPYCTTWCRPDIDTLCTASYAHSRTHSLIACAHLRHTSPRPLCRAKHGTHEWTHTLQAEKQTDKQTQMWPLFKS